MGDYDDETQHQRQDGVAYARSQPRLAWTDSGGAHSLVLTQRAVLGSAAGVDLRVLDREVSRIHAELDPTDRGTWIRDLGSRNGVYVEGIRVTGALIPEGARIRVGSTELSVDYAGSPVPVDLWPENCFHRMIGASVLMRELFAQLERVAATDSPVLIQGETGTGKELAAQAIHDASPRSQGPFVVVDCAALPASLLEAELFGHARGAFTGAVTARAGSFESADGGTLFLDEIGELSLSMQPKLLRVLDSMTIRRVGETAYRQVDFRVVAATNRDLRQMVNAGAFREDLYFRLAVLPVALPPLRERPTDIPLLVRNFLAGRTLPALNIPELQTMPWLGNVRELFNYVERCCTLGDADPPPSRRVGPPPPSVANEAQPPSSRTPFEPQCSFDQPFKEFRERWLEAGERRYIRGLLERTGHNVAAAAAAAGLDRTYVYRLIKKHGLGESSGGTSTPSDRPPPPE
jgi:two-component system, NtrC family, response regulator GlrR